MSESAAQTMSEDLVRDMICRDELTRLTKKSNFTAAFFIILDFVLILAAASVSEAFWHPLLYVVVLMFIGARQIGIGSIALHEATHRMMFKNSKANDYFAKALNIILFLPLITKFDDYRKAHFMHHKNLAIGGDPEANVYATAYKRSRKARLIRCLRLISGFAFGYLTLKFVKKKWRGSVAGRLGIAGLCMALLICFLYIPQVLLFIFLYWILPLATWGLFVNEIRVVAEHFPPQSRYNSTPEFAAREVLLSPFDRLFVVTRSVNFHLSHHLFPAVPFYNLERLQNTISETDKYRANAVVLKNYWTFFKFYYLRAT